MKIISISSQKGGVGKTTVSINLAHAFARLGRKTLLIDTDPQGSVGLSLTRQSRLLSGFYDLLLHPAKVKLKSTLVSTRLDTLSLLPVGQASDYDLQGKEKELTTESFVDFFEQVEKEGFDICIVDTAAGVFGLTSAILSASDAVMILQQAEPLGIRSVPKMLEALNQLKTKNPNMEVLGMLLTMTQPSLAECSESIQALREILPKKMVFDTMIPRDDIFIRASAKGLPVGLMEGGGGVLSICDDLCSEVELRVKDLDSEFAKKSNVRKRRGRKEKKT